MTNTSKLLAMLFVAAFAAPAFADDGFTAVHEENQKIGSAVSEYWAGYAAQPLPPAPDGFMAIHMANQKIGSAVANFWRLLAKTDCSATAEPSP